MISLSIVHKYTMFTLREQMKYVNIINEIEMFKDS